MLETRRRLAHVTLEPTGQREMGVMILAQSRGVLLLWRLLMKLLLLLLLRRLPLLTLALVPVLG